VAATVRRLMEKADADGDGLLGVEDLLLLAMVEDDALSSGASVCLSMGAALALTLHVKAEAGPSVGSSPDGLTPGELARWLAPLDPTLARTHAACAAALVAGVQRDRGTGWWRAATPFERATAAANRLRAATVRSGSAAPNEVYDGAVPAGLVSRPALRRAAERLALPLSAAEVDRLASWFPAPRPEGPNGAAARSVDFDAIVRFLTS
jgi:hypothetical protein